ncbi:MAG: hypothetical protein QM742_07070 [Aquabacterium sp.]
MSDINPTQLATQLATSYTQGLQTQLTAQTKSVQGRATALTKLQTALQTFDSALAALFGQEGHAGVVGQLQCLWHRHGHGQRHCAARHLFAVCGAGGHAASGRV